METQEILLLAIVVILAAAAVYIAMTEKAPEIVPEPGQDATAAESLLVRGVGFGQGMGDYVQSYSETMDGYVTSYRITRNGEEGLVEIENQLSSKKLFFLANDTVLCISYPDDEVCSSVKDNDEVKNYVRSIEVKFLNDSIIRRNVQDITYLMEKGYAKIDAKLEDTAVDGKTCTRIDYTIDYSNVTVSEAARFGVGATTPKIFDWSMCISNQTGRLIEKRFNYTYDDMEHEYLYILHSFTDQSTPIEAPDNVTPGAVSKLRSEREQQKNLAECYTTKRGEDFEKCVTSLAYKQKRTDLCELSGGRRDLCLVALVPVTKDTAICEMINDPAFRDDCQIELAGAYKDSTYCDSVVESSKKEFCLEVSQPPEEETAVNESNVDISDFMEEIDKGE